MAIDIASIVVNGISCEHHIESIKAGIGKLNGILKVTINLEVSRVVVEHDPDKVSVDTIKDVIRDLGYEVK